MKKMVALVMTLCIAMSICVSPVQAASFYRYGHSDGHWGIDFATNLNRYGVITTDELNSTKFDDNANPEYIANIIYKANYTANNPGKTLDKLKIRNKDINTWIEEHKNESSITRGEFAHLINIVVDKKNMLEINVIDDNDIPDIQTGHKYYNDIYNIYRWGLMGGTDLIGTFSENGLVTNGQLFAVADHILNPNTRVALSLYGDDEITVQSEVYPMTYHNKSKGLDIEVNKENYYGAVCYVAHIKMKNPAHLKTTYALQYWSAVGAPATMVDERLNSILIVNGDYRSETYGENLGIIRNRQIVNNKTVNGIGMTLDGKISEVKGDPKVLLDNNIRDTWTFGPVLVKNGAIIPKNDPDAARHPRTFIGQVYRTDDVLEYYIVVADGRQPEYSMGLTNYEMATILAAKGCTFGYNLDGGGSSVIRFNGKTLNRPSDGSERTDVDYIYIK